MKTTKKTAAIILAVLFILSMIPFAVNAATHKLTVKVGYPNYTVKVYQVATVDATTGNYTITDNNAPEAVKTQVNAAEKSTANLFAALENQTTLGYPESGTLTTTATVQQKDFEGLEPGIYYVKFTSRSSTNDTAGNSVVVIDNADVTLDIKAEGKVTEGEAYVHKKIIEGGQEVTKTTTGNLADDSVQFKLWAKITGSKTNKLANYEIRDLMDAGLSSAAADLTINSVEYEDGTAITEYTPTKPTGYTFAIAIGSKTLNSDTFYDHNQVVVKFTTKLSNTAVNKTVYKNHDDLYFKNKSDQESTVNGDDVEVQTYKPSLKKYIAGGTTPLKDAEFKLYKNDKTTVIGYGKSDADGNVAFYTTEGGTQLVYLKKGTYYAKETAAPANYNLNNSWIELQENDTDFVYTANAYNTPVKLPTTGDAGTLAITLTGLGLILVSGAMFVVLMRKRSSK